MTSRRSHLILVGLILAALAGVAALGIPGSPVHKKVTLGLDLQGGLEVVLKANPQRNQQVTSDGMDTAISAMRNRVDALGVSEPEIRRQGNDQIVIQLAGVHDPNKAAAIIGTTAQLQFYDLEADVAGPSSDGNGHVVANPSLYNLLNQVQGEAKKGTPTQYYLSNKAKKPIAGPEDTRAKLLATPKLKGKVPPGAKGLVVPQNRTVVSCDQATTGCIGAQQVAPTYYYLFKYFPGRADKPIPEATGKDL